MPGCGCAQRCQAAAAQAAVVAAQALNPEKGLKHCCPLPSVPKAAASCSPHQTQPRPRRTSSRPAMTDWPKAESQILSNAHWSYRCSAFSPLMGTPTRAAVDSTCRRVMRGWERGKRRSGVGHFCNSSSSAQRAGGAAHCRCKASLLFPRRCHAPACHHTALPPRFPCPPSPHHCPHPRTWLSRPSGEQRPSMGCSQSRISTHVKDAVAPCRFSISKMGR